MIFVLEKYFQDQKSSLEAWKRAREAWVSDPKYVQYYRSDSDYERKYPRPGHAFRAVKPVLTGILIAAIVCGSGFGLGAAISHKHKNDAKKPHTAQTEEYKAKVDDKVQVVYGDYKDSVGVIVKVGNGDAIIKITHSTFTKDMCKASNSCSSDGGRNEGDLLGVASLDNLVPYKEVK